MVSWLRLKVPSSFWQSFYPVYEFPLSHVLFCFPFFPFLYDRNFFICLIESIQCFDNESKKIFLIAIFLPRVLTCQKREISLPVSYKTVLAKTEDWEWLWRHFRTFYFAVWSFLRVTTALVIRKEMVQKCVVYGCSNTKDEKKGISIHTIPFFNDSRPEAMKRRRKWISFVNATWKNWTVSKHSVICSVHFSPEDFSRLYFEEQKYQQWLKKEEETNRDVHMKRREVGWAFSPLLIISCMRYTVRIKTDLPCVFLHEKACSFFIPYLTTAIVDSSCGVPFSLAWVFIATVLWYWFLFFSLIPVIQVTLYVFVLAHDR